jgi:hypothetical protein
VAFARGGTHEAHPGLAFVAATGYVTPAERLPHADEVLRQ